MEQIPAAGSTSGGKTETRIVEAVTAADAASWCWNPMFSCHINTVNMIDSTDAVCVSLHSFKSVVGFGGDNV